MLIIILIVTVVCIAAYKGITSYSDDYVKRRNNRGRE